MLPDLIANLHLQAAQRFNEELENYVRFNLRKLGFTFSTNEELYDFASKRITAVNSGNCTTLFLDTTPESTGIVIGYYSDKCEIEYSDGGFNVGGKITITFGR